MERMSDTSMIPLRCKDSDDAYPIIGRIPRVVDVAVSGRTTNSSTMYSGSESSPFWNSDDADVEHDDSATHALAAALRVDPNTQQRGRGLTISFEKSQKAQRTARTQHVRGRQVCGCNAAADQYTATSGSDSDIQALGRHRLFANCTACGRIHCEREGEGPCFFCASYVTARGTHVNADFVSGAPPGQAEYASVSAAGLERATQHKDKLMSFAANKAKRTSIIDDQSDFYDLFGSMDDAWLDQTERSERLLKAQAEHERLHQPRSAVPIQFSLTLGASNATVIEIAPSTTSVHTTLHTLATIPGSSLSCAPTSSVGAAFVASSGSGYYSNNTLTGPAGRVYAALLAARDLVPKVAASSAAKSISNSHPIVSATACARVQSEPIAHCSDRAQKSATEVCFSSISLKSGANAIALPEQAATAHPAPLLRVYDQSALARIEKEWRLQDDKFVDFRSAAANALTAAATADAAATNLGNISASASNKSLPRVDDSAGDSGMCLSMHQPWASLLVLGIKRIEGRSWFSSHRGRMWIHAAAHEPTELEIATVEQQYKTMYKSSNIPFPKKYPISAIVGCVDVVDFLTSEQLSRKLQLERQAHHMVNVFNYAELNDSPCLFVCRNPMKVRLPIKCTGQHKLWQLSPQVHSVAKKSLLGCDHNWWLHAVSELLYPSAPDDSDSDEKSANSVSNCAILSSGTADSELFWD